MEHCRVFLAVLVVSTVTLVCFGDEIKTVDPISGIETKKSSPLNDSSIVKPSGSKPVLADEKKKSVDQNVASQDGTKDVPEMKKSSKELDAKDVPVMGSDKDHSSKESHVKDGSKKEGASYGSKSNMVPKGVTKEESRLPRKESSRGEECGSSIKCIDKNNKLIACLRVPGNESPELSLLIQNKGTNPLSVKISAPDFVHLENNTVQLPENDYKTVKVSIGTDSKTKDTLIVLTVKDGNCSIDFRDLILHNSEKKADNINNSASTDIITKVPSVVLVFIAAVILVASAWMCVRFRRKHVHSDGSKYQKLEAVLPVSGGVKTESDVIDGWDDSWGDSWDDEEAPKTPSLPITPSLSSKGLASRKLSKEGRKD